MKTKIIIAISFLALFGIMEFLTQSVKQKEAEQLLNKTIAMLEKKGVNFSDGITEQEALILKAQKSPTPSKKGLIAVDRSANFLSFYYSNTISRVKYCSDLGIDISSFKDEMDTLYGDEVKRSKSTISTIYAGSVYSEFKEYLTIVIKINMETLAHSENLTTSEVCQYFMKNPKLMVKQLGTAYQKFYE